MKTLYSLIQSLQPSEIEIIRSSLSSYYSKEEKDFKTLKLFDLLLKSKKKVPDINECSLAIYGKERDNTIDKLASRLRSKILDALTLDVNIERKGMLDELDASVLKVKKKMMQFLFLYRSRGNSHLANQLLDDVIAYSKKYEIYDTIVEGLKFKKYVKGYTRGLDDFNKLNDEIEFYEYCMNIVNKANDYYYRLILRADFHANIDKKQRLKYLHDAIVDLTEDYRKTNSAIVGYYLKLLELAYLHDNEDMERARQVGHEMLDILKNNKSVYRKHRLGFTYGNITQCDIFLGDYESAAKNVREVLAYTPAKGVNYAVAKELEFHALFYAGHYNEADKVLDVLLNVTSTLDSDFRIAKSRFYRACVLFCKGNYKAALKDLLQNAQLPKDKIGWEIAIRLLICMTLVELGSFDEAEKQVESLSKYVERHEKKSDISQRDQLIVKLMQKLQKSGFVFVSLTEEIKSLQMLASSDKKHKWEPFSSELIPVHSWILSKGGSKLQSALNKSKEPVTG